ALCELLVVRVLHQAQGDARAGVLGLARRRLVAPVRDAIGRELEPPTSELLLEGPIVALDQHLLERLHPGETPHSSAADLRLLLRVGRAERVVVLGVEADAVVPDDESLDRLRAATVDVRERSLTAAQ